MAPDKYPEIELLRKAMLDHNIGLTAEPHDEGLQKLSYRRIKITFLTNIISLVIPVDDEYNDVDKRNPLVLLHLVVDACATYEESGDFLVWCKDNGLSASEPVVRNIYFELRDVVPRIREIVGPDVHALSSWDFQMNTGVTQALRNAVL